MKLLIAVIFVVLVCSAAQPQSVPQLADGKITGTGFVITVPPDTSVEIGANSESEHGFYIELPTHAPSPDSPALRRSTATTEHISSHRYIAFDTKWDIGDMPSLQAVVDNIASNLLDNIPPRIVGSGDVTLDANLPVRLGTLPARRLVIKYRDSEKKPAIRQVIVAYNARKDASAIVYLLVLNTTQQNFQEDVTVFSKVLAGFKLTDQ